MRPFTHKLDKHDPDERFLANTSDGIDHYLSHLKTIRLGEVAYDIYGDVIKNPKCKPMFIHKSERMEWNRIMDARLRAIMADIPSEVIDTWDVHEILKWERR